MRFVWSAHDKVVEGGRAVGFSFMKSYWEFIASVHESQVQDMRTREFVFRSRLRELQRFHRFPRVCHCSARRRDFGMFQDVCLLSVVCRQTFEGKRLRPCSLHVASFPSLPLSAHTVVHALD